MRKIGELLRKLWRCTKQQEPFYHNGLSSIPARESNYIHYVVWDEIIYPFQTSKVAPLKFGNRSVISSHTLLGM